MPEEFVVTPYQVTGEIDYDLLIQKFGTKKIDDGLLKRLGKYGPLHHMLRRGIFYSHRDLEWILNEYDKGHGFSLYTGRGPSGPIHLGHLMPWVFCKYLQDTFKAKLWFQLTDDEKFMFYDHLTLEETRKWGYDNALDIIALGFDPKLTNIFLDTEYIKTMYPTAIKAAKKINFSTIRAVFGFDNSNNIGSIFFTSIQTVPCFLESMEQKKKVACLIPCGIDQDPHFRITRDIAEGLGYYKPALIHAKLMPSLSGGEKMSTSSKADTTVFTTDDKKTVKKKIGNAFTGGRVSVEEQKKLGGNPDICSVHAYNTYFFEPDDEKLAKLYSDCRAGRIMCGECKQLLFEKVWKFLEEHQRRREKAEDVVEDFFVRD
ncbi:MAG: tryptophan--tRNA ligase [Euryarchaeota archaeon RBG_13_57_23]|nr:MAG: tryptophan--tRNA ligase [Euryarchaeota archaeon RBG_13_57_23]